MPPTAANSPTPRPQELLAGRWRAWRQLAGIAADEPLALALSGGADSVLLLRALCAAEPRPPLLAVHVDHGLRGAESEADARFCQDLCARLGVELIVRKARLDPAAPGLEARAREARYRLLTAEARAHGHLTLLTGHHADDELETLLMRWMRGTALEGLRGARREMILRGTAPGVAPGDEALEPVRVVRPLLPLRRAEVREILELSGQTWREDSSNVDPRFTRSRVRASVLPSLERTCGLDAPARLSGFARAVENLERQLARATAHLAWSDPPFAGARGCLARERTGGEIARSALVRLPDALLRRALWRLLSEGTGQAIGRDAIQELMGDLRTARTGRRSLPGDWTLLLRSAALELLPPAAGASAEFATFRESLTVPGEVELPDGRWIRARFEERAASPQRDPGRAPSRDLLCAELDPARLTRPLELRFARPGDRLQPLGAPGTRPLTRFLADSGIPREERGRIPLVLHGDEIIWVAGLRPSEPWRLRPASRRHLRLELSASAARRSRDVG